MHHIYHLLRILVSLGSLLCQEVLAVYAYRHIPGIQLVEQVLTVQRLLGGGTTLAASGTVAGCTESLLHGTLRSNKYERITAHIAWYEHGLTYCTILFRYSRMAGRKGTSRSLAVDTDALQLPVDFVLFHLG